MLPVKDQVCASAFTPAARNRISKRTHTLTFVFLIEFFLFPACARCRRRLLSRMDVRQSAQGQPICKNFAKIVGCPTSALACGIRENPGRASVGRPYAA